MYSVTVLLVTYQTYLTVWLLLATDLAYPAIMYSGVKQAIPTIADSAPSNKKNL